jgi:hypothetical protein
MAYLQQHVLHTLLFLRNCVNVDGKGAPEEDVTGTMPNLTIHR